MPSKALIVFGSESGTAEKAIKEQARSGAAAPGPSDIIDGNAAAKRGANARDEPRRDHHATSSFARRRAVQLRRFSRGAVPGDLAESPFAGCQHAVLGFGDSQFDTYMDARA